MNECWWPTLIHLDVSLLSDAVAPDDASGEDKNVLLRG